nr:MAG: hypothetical protein DIU58_18275 [Sphaerobacter thermophilus]
MCRHARERLTPIAAAYRFWGPGATRFVARPPIAISRSSRTGSIVAVAILHLLAATSCGAVA